MKVDFIEIKNVTLKKNSVFLVCLANVKLIFKQNSDVFPASVNNWLLKLKSNTGN